MTRPAPAAATGGALLTCPFCGLLCDDLRPRDDGAVDTRGCPRGAAGFARATTDAAHRVGGRTADLAAAAQAAASLLARARRPLVAGLTTDLDGLRAALALAERTGAAVDHGASAALLPGLEQQRTTGWMATTFAEVANRADLVLLAGCDPDAGFPRFSERLLRNPAPLYRERAPRVLHLGPAPPAATAVEERIATAPGGLPDALMALAAIARGKTPRHPAPGGVPIAALRDLAARLRDARYAVLVWDAAALVATEAPLALEALVRLIEALAPHTRCVGLPLGGGGNAQGAAQTMLWQAGWPGRFAYGPDGPEHDPWRFDARRMLAAGEADALVWIAALASEPPPATDAPVIALVTADVALPAPPAVEIRVGCAALDHGGWAVRGDGIVMLPLRAARPTAAPSVATAARAILDALGPPA